MREVARNPREPHGVKTLVASGARLVVAMPCQELEVFPPEKLTPTLVVPPVTSLPVFAKIRIPCEYVVKLKLGELMLIART